MYRGQSHPQAGDDSERRRYAGLRGETPPDPCVVDAWLDRAGIGPIDGAPDNIWVTGQRLYAKATSQKKKAAGVDGWRPADLALLPLEWFNALAEIWNVVLASGSMPSTWANVRMVGIPKNDGSGALRGLGIAHIAWRLGMSEVVAQHKMWIQNWLHHSIKSGPGRIMDEILEDLIDDLFDADDGNNETIGAKVDIAKFFDRCSIDRSVRILGRLGASDHFLRILRTFYTQLNIFVQAGEAYGPSADKADLSIYPDCALANGYLMGVSCLPCVSGTYFDQLLRCRECAKGCYQAMTGTAACNICGAGTFAEAPGSVSSPTLTLPPHDSVPISRSAVASPPTHITP